MSERPAAAVEQSREVPDLLRVYVKRQGCDCFQHNRAPNDRIAILLSIKHGILKVWTGALPDTLPPKPLSEESSVAETLPR